MSPASDKAVAHLAECLKKEVIDDPDAGQEEPSAERALEIFEKLNDLTGISIEQLESTKIGKFVTKSRRSMQRYKRKASSQDDVENWEKAVKIADSVLDKWKKDADHQAKEDARRKKAEAASSILVDEGGTGQFPSSVAEYRLRLVTQKKDMYKDPPVLPPSKVTVESKQVGMPSRDKKTGLLSFSAGDDSTIKTLLKDFHPNRTPEGTYVIYWINVRIFYFFFCFLFLSIVLFLIRRERRDDDS